MLEEGYGSDSVQTQNQQGDQNFIPQQQAMNPNVQPFIPQQQVLNPNAQPFVPQQVMNPNAQPFVPQQVMNPNAQPFVPQQVMNPNAQPFVPQQVMNPNAQPFVPQQVMNPNAQPFVPQQVMNPRYPYIPDNTPVDPQLLNFIIGLPLSSVPYEVTKPWHMGWETWAYEENINGGYVSHFNVRSGSGSQIHVYYNRNGQLQAVGLGQKPTGY